MSSPIRFLISAQRRITITLFPLLVFTIIAPLTVSCQRGAAEQDRGIENLRELVKNASGRPAADDLTRIESRFPRTRTAALAQFLKGYLYYSSQNYKDAIEALDTQAISGMTALGDYAFFYRAESEAENDVKRDARRDYLTVSSQYPDSLKTREAKLHAAEMAIGLGDPATAIKDLARMTEAKDAQAVLVTAQAHEAAGKIDESIRLYRQIYYEMPA